MKTKSFEEFSKEVSKELATRLALQLTLVLLLLAVPVGYYYFNFVVSEKISTYEPQFKYWLKVGDIFSIRRTLSSIGSKDMMIIRNGTGDIIETNVTSGEYLNSLPNSSDFSNLKFINSSLYLFSFKNLLTDEGSSIGQIQFGTPLPLIEILFCIVLIMIISWFLTLFSLGSFKSFSNEIKIPLLKLSQIVSNARTPNDLLIINPDKISISEFSNFAQRVRELALRIKDQEDEIKESEREKSIGQLARKVAHDIRSPLSVLKTLIKSSNEIPEADRNLLSMASDRMSNIANDLLVKAKELEKDEIPSESLNVPLQEIVEEKKIEYGDKVTVNLVSEANICSRVNSIEFQSMVSNFINNSIEAGASHVDILLEKTDQAFITLKDNGNGFNKELLSQLGKVNLTTKGNGNGIGIMNAKKLITSWDGDLVLFNNELGGASVKVSLPLTEPR